MIVQVGLGESGGVPPYFDKSSVTFQSRLAPGSPAPNEASCDYTMDKLMEEKYCIIALSRG